MNNVSVSSSSGITFCGLLTIVFIVLKLIGKITWSWLCVLAPLWLPISIAIIIGLVVILITFFKIKRK